MTYFQTLLSSCLPFAEWLAVTLWPVLFIANRLIGRALMAVSDRSTSYTFENRDRLRRGSEPLWVLAQCLFAGWVFTISLYAGGPLFVFLAGGLDVSLICVLGLNVQGLLSARAMARPGASTGSLKLSTSCAYRQMAGRLYGIAAICTLLGLLVAHTALLGGALFAASTATGYLRRADQHASVTDRSG